jgi:dCTP deaminase
VILPDTRILALARFSGMIDPCASGERRPGVISYGVSSYGYDARLADDLLVFPETDDGRVIDPKDFDRGIARRLDPDEDGYFIPPQGFVLGHTVETFRIPRDVMVICLGKSTYARCGLIVNVTPLEPGWEGQVTLELHNTTNLPIRLYPGEGVCQFIFLQGDVAPSVSYADRAGKYMGQSGVVLPRMEVGADG